MDLTKRSQSIAAPGKRSQSMAAPGFAFGDEVPPAFGMRTKSQMALGMSMLQSIPTPVLPPPAPIDEDDADKEWKSSQAALLRDEQDRPTPFDFDAFLPFICKQMGLPEIVHITRLYQDRFVSGRKKHGAKKKAKIMTSEILERSTKQSLVIKAPPSSRKTLEKSQHSAKQHSSEDNVYSAKAEDIPVKVYYDSRNRLVELSITRCNFVRQMLIKAINLTLPFHTSFSKICITKCKLDQAILYEIGKMIPHSYFTEMIFDDTRVRQSNYYLVLDKGSKLKRLSLNRCSINDVVVHEICQRLDFGTDAGKTLQILELSCNSITDTGAHYIGEILKKNRSLLHINLAGNRITDEGATFMLDQLQMFLLSNEDLLEMRDKKREYYKKKAAVFEKCYEEQMRQRQNWSSRSVVPSGRPAKSTKSTKPSPVSPQAKGVKSRKSVFDVKVGAQIMTDLLMGGPFKHLFEDAHVIRIDGEIYCKGNFHLCSLNIAYNNVGYFTLKKLYDVLKYQSEALKPADDFGLMRITIEGNLIPYDSEEFMEVDNYLKKAIALKPIKKSEPVASTSRSTKKSVDK